MIITDVTWLRDHRQRPVLALGMDGQSAHFPSKQRTEMLRRGLVKGVVGLASEWRERVPNHLIQGDIEPGLTAFELDGCTDDPRVFALFEEMSRAILAGAWLPGPRPPALLGQAR